MGWRHKAWRFLCGVWKGLLYDNNNNNNNGEMKRWDMRDVVLYVCVVKNDSERQSIEDDGVDNGKGTSVWEQCTCWVSNTQ